MDRMAGWLQLIDSSLLSEAESAGVWKFFEGYRDADPNCDKEEVVFTPSGVALPFSMVFWEGWPPDVAHDFEVLVPVLEESSFLLFMYTTRCGYFIEPVKFIMVTNTMVYSLNGSDAYDQFVTDFKMKRLPWQTIPSQKEPDPPETAL